MTRIPHETSGEPNPPHALGLDRLRRRTGMKGRTCPEDVLPLWAAGMDVPLAEPIVRAVTGAMEPGDTGSPAQTFLRHGRAALDSGLPSGTGGAGHARLNLAASPEVPGEAVRRMAAVVERAGGARG